MKERQKQDSRVFRQKIYKKYVSLNKLINDQFTCETQSASHKNNDE